MSKWIKYKESNPRNAIIFLVILGLILIPVALNSENPLKVIESFMLIATFIVLYLLLIRKKNE